MTKYSRVSKYEDLRNKLQNDTDTKIESKDLSRYKKKLHTVKKAMIQFMLDVDNILIIQMK